MDEIHKNRRWRNWLKGLYDTHAHTSVPNRHKILRRRQRMLGSLFSRRRLPPRPLLRTPDAPPPLSETLGATVPDSETVPAISLGSSRKTQARSLDDLQRLGGFPEPFLGASDELASRWRAGYGARLIQQDVRDLEQIQDLARLELLYDRLPDTVGSTLSINSLREDLEVAHQTVSKWLTILR